MLTSMAVVQTDASARYAKQLLSHLGNKVTVEALPEQPEPAGRLIFSYGVGTVLPMTGRLVLKATAATAEDLAHVEDVMARHLVRFGARAELEVSWDPAVEVADVDPASPEIEITADPPSVNRSS